MDKEFFWWMNEKLRAFPEFKGYNQTQLHEIYVKELEKGKKSLQKKVRRGNKGTKVSKSNSLLLACFPLKVVDLYNIANSYYEGIIEEIDESLNILKKIRKKDLRDRVLDEAIKPHSSGLKMKIIAFINEETSNGFNNHHFEDKDLKEAMDSSVRDCSDILIDLIIENNPEIKDLGGIGADKAELKIKKSVKWSE